jgi:hypothetical protein
MPADRPSLWTRNERYFYNHHIRYYHLSEQSEISLYSIHVASRRITSISVLATYQPTSQIRLPPHQAPSSILWDTLTARSRTETTAPLHHVQTTTRPCSTSRNTLPSQRLTSSELYTPPAISFPLPWPRRRISPSSLAGAWPQSPRRV